ncbi:hypothetical protein EV126DRAFT_217431 [Verticillium dahliae]|nr:hypothetical protein EV126DRAFT_217431 [Verticillium dahliae]
MRTGPSKDCQGGQSLRPACVLLVTGHWGAVRSPPHTAAAKHREWERQTPASSNVQRNDGGGFIPSCSSSSGIGLALEARYCVTAFAGTCFEEARLTLGMRWDGTLAEAGRNEPVTAAETEGGVGAAVEEEHGRCRRSRRSLRGGVVLSLRANLSLVGPSSCGPKLLRQLEETRGKQVQRASLEINWALFQRCHRRTGQIAGHKHPLG